MGDIRTVAEGGTLPELLDQRRPPDETTFLRTVDGSAMSYGHLQNASARLAGALAAHGVGVGDRVAVQVEKSASAVLLHVALLRLGAVQLPLNPAYTDGEVSALLNDAEPSLLVRDPSRPTLVGPWRTLTLDADGAGSLADAAASAEPFSESVEITPESPAALLYTSGTTGRPKGALLSHGNLVHNAITLVDAWAFTGDDVLLHVLPLFHTHGLFVATHCVLASGASMLLLPRFDLDEVLDGLTTSTVLMGVPTHYARLLDDQRFDRALADRQRLFVSGSAPMTVSLHRQFTARTGQVVLERYGMTETSMLASNPLEGTRKAGTVGQPLPGVGIRVVDNVDSTVAVGDVGAVQVNGPNVFSGYWRRPELRDTEFTRDGWFRTGDLGRWDDDGYLELVGRSKDLVISGGMNVYPKEVETVLDSLDGVVESAVVGLPDADLGEVVVAVVVASAEAELDVTALLSSARQRLAGFKLPKRIVVVDALPRNAMGKVEKARLRADLLQASA